MEENSVVSEKPNLPDWLFWEVNLETINWKKAFKSVIERVLDRGSEEEIEELIRFYGRDRVRTWCWNSESGAGTGA